mmetsp:Transcript_131/g.286  ORF Transcript_131/g.286 Transcript_131/m.286 type:complete len:347 (-) Transcript_131:81-1121(-)
MQAMDLLRGALSCVPIVGPAAGAIDAASRGDHFGTAFEVAGLAFDLCSAGGMSGSKTAVHSLACSGVWSTAKGTARCAAERLRHVAKTTLKQKAKRRMKRTALKLGLASAAAVHDMLRHEDLTTFATAASREAEIHAQLAQQAYLSPTHRKGLLFNSEASPEEQLWYAYVGGDSRKGFWYCPAACNGGGHLILSERGTHHIDGEDLFRDTGIALGVSYSAVVDRAKQSLEDMWAQIECHSCARVTVTGHSLGGAVAACMVGAEGTVKWHTSGLPQMLDAVHIFNAGGVPDLRRYLTTRALWPTIQVHAHRIVGDVISVGFLPCQRSYARKPGLEATDSHRLLHFIP